MLSITKQAVVFFYPSPHIIHAAEPIFLLLYTNPSLSATSRHVFLPRVFSLINHGGFSLPDIFVLFVWGALVHICQAGEYCIAEHGTVAWIPGAHGDAHTVHDAHFWEF